jgi:hypothetical protein
MDFITIMKIKKKRNNRKNILNNITIDTKPFIYNKRAIFSFFLVGFSFFYISAISAKGNAMPDCYSAKLGATMSEISFNDKTQLFFGIPVGKKSQGPENMEKPIKYETVSSFQSELNKKIISIVKNTPMEKMASQISKQNRTVAGLLVGIAMKESKFGIYSPKKNGHDCFNYWGYRGKENPTASGYSCFKSPEEAVRIVGGRIEDMVNDGADRPAEMIAWKCGYTCAGHDRESVRKWIADVSIHYYQIASISQVAKN